MLKTNSNKVEKGDTFVAIKGFTVDGHNFVSSAIEKGATTVVIDHDMDLPSHVNKIIVEDTAAWLDETVVNTYKDKVNKLNLIGITGTNGKTTTAYLVYQMLNKLGKRTSYIGTIGYHNADGEFIELANTTPNILDLYTLLLESLENNEEAVVMEVSSIALDMGRTKGLLFNSVVFTNLTQDHLDYHKSMNNYLEAKLKITKQLDGMFIGNTDDVHTYFFFDSVESGFGYGVNGNLGVKSYSDTDCGTKLYLEYNNECYEVENNLKGKFNVYNFIAASSVLLNNGYTMEDIISITPYIYPPKGRCETYKVGDGLAVVDYAHTPDAVEKIINVFDNNSYNRIITVIGCGGDRDATKRPIMGSIATEKSDYVVFTNDNPRTEDEAEIMHDIVSTLTKDNYTIVYDRKAAIELALSMIEPGDVVLVLGKGHEDYQIIGRTKHHFDDSEVINEYVKSMGQKVRTLKKD